MDADKKEMRENRMRPVGELLEKVLNGLLRKDDPKKILPKEAEDDE